MKAKTPKNKFEQYLALQSAALAELLEERKALQAQLRREVLKFEKALAKNAGDLAKLGHKVKETGVLSLSNTRLPDDEIKERLQVILAGKKRLSIPDLLKKLHIARTRFAAFHERNKGYLDHEGGGRSTVYFLKK